MSNVVSRLAGCVQILPAMTSIYHWEDRIEEAAEVMLLIKTRRPLYDQLEARLRQLHPYQTPEILALPVSAGATGYRLAPGGDFIPFGEAQPGADGNRLKSSKDH